jgi:hypothetical protein
MASVALLTLSQSLDPVLQTFAAKGWLTALTGIGLDITGVAFLLEFVSGLLDYWTQGGAQAAVGRFLRLLVITAIPVAMLTNWQAAAGSNASLTADITNFFFQDIPNALGLAGNGSLTSSAGIDAAVQADGKAWGDITSMLWNHTPPTQGISASTGTAPAPAPAPAASTASTAKPATGSAYDNALNVGSNASKTGILGSISAWLSNFGTWLWSEFISLYALITISVCMLLLTVALIFALYGPLFMLNIGMIFGPILVAGLPWRPTRGWFTRWIDYMMTMGGAYVIGLLLATMGAVALNNFASNLTAAYNAAGAGGAQAQQLAFANTVAVSAFPIMVSMLFLTLMLMRVERIASALFGGMAIEGGGALAAVAGASALRASLGGKPKPPTPGPVGGGATTRPTPSGPPPMPSAPAPTKTPSK